MIRIKFTIVSILLLQCFQAQTVMQTFSDVFKSQLLEEYQVNASGEKHGWYKGYGSNGIVKEKATFKRGRYDGLYQFYDVTTGRAIIQEEITYKEGVKNGPYKLYSMDEFHVVEEQGNYINNFKEGVWISIKLVSKDYPPGFTHSKMTFTLVNGEIQNASSKSYYYNSGKLFKEAVDFKNGFMATEYSPSGSIFKKEYYSNQDYPDSVYSYFENGKVARIEVLYREGVFTFRKDIRYSPDGKLIQKKIEKGNELIEYEGYNEDGSKNEAMLEYEEQKRKEQQWKQKELTERNAANAKRSQESIEVFNKAIARGNEHYDKQEYDKAKNEFGMAKRMNQNSAKSDSVFMKHYNSQIGGLNWKISSVDSLTFGDSQEFYRVKTEVDAQNSEIDSRRALINTNRVISENNKEGSTTSVYAKGKLAYDYLIDSRKRQRDYKLKLKEGDLLLNYLTSWNTCISQPSKALNKKLEILTEPQDIINIIQNSK